MSVKSEATGPDVWRLVHGEGAPIKKAAVSLKLSLSRAYELLAEERLRREIAAHRQAASASVVPMKK
jgi:hypothetical protein